MCSICIMHNYLPSNAIWETDSTSSISHISLYQNTQKSPLLKLSLFSPILWHIIKSMYNWKCQQKTYRSVSPHKLFLCNKCKLYLHISYHLCLPVLTVSLPNRISTYGMASIIGSLKNWDRNGALRFIINGQSWLRAWFATSIMDGGLTVRKKP